MFLYKIEVSIDTFFLCVCCDHYVLLFVPVVGIAKFGNFMEDFSS